MIRTAIGLTLVAASLGAQAPAQSPTAADSTAILVAARAQVTKRDSTVNPDWLKVRADTAWVTVWVREGRFGHDGQEVRVERRAGKWTALRSDTTRVVRVRY